MLEKVKALPFAKKFLSHHNPTLLKWPVALFPYGGFWTIIYYNTLFKYMCIFKHDAYLKRWTKVISIKGSLTELLKYIKNKKNTFKIISVGTKL